MELELKNISLNPLYDINLKISNNITALTGEDSDKLIDILLERCLYNGEKNITKNNMFLVEKNLNRGFLMPTLRKYLNFTEGYYNTKFNIDEALKELDINKEFLDKKINELSKSDEKLLQFIIAVSLDKDLLILDEPFIYLDKFNEKKLIKYLDKIKNNKIIIIKTNNPNKIYNYSDNVIILKDHRVLKVGNTKEIYEDVKYLRKNNLLIPDTVLFTSKANNKKIKLDFHKDIRDLIKDVYRHV